MKSTIHTILTIVMAFLALPALAFGKEPAAGTLIQLNSAEGMVKVLIAFLVLDYFRRRMKRNDA